MHLIQIASERAMRYVQKRSASDQNNPMIFYFCTWNVASAREGDFTAPMVWRRCAPQRNTVHRAPKRTSQCDRWADVLLKNCGWARFRASRRYVVKANFLPRL